MGSVEAELKDTDPNYKLTIIEIPSIAQVFPELSDVSKSDKLDVLAIIRTHRESLVPMMLPSTSIPQEALVFPKQSRRHIGSCSTSWPSVSVSFSSQNSAEFSQWSIQRRSRSSKHGPPRVRMLGVQLPPFHAMGLCVQLTLPLLPLRHHRHLPSSGHRASFAADGAYPR